ncbi:MAG TPA: hypothetical protein VNO79_00870 [Actinomycetota bacterium]|nr:hypothetical protein [Actinomycetota bacterium]
MTPVIAEPAPETVADPGVEPTPGCVRCERFGPDHGGVPQSPCIAAWEDIFRRDRWLRRRSLAWREGGL